MLRDVAVSLKDVACRGNGLACMEDFMLASPAAITAARVCKCTPGLSEFYLWEKKSIWEEEGCI